MVARFTVPAVMVLLVCVNVPALGLYHSLGFNEVYRYHYRRPPGA